MAPERLQSPLLSVRHGFFTRRGGVSDGPYASLNCSLSGGDAPDRLTRNRALVGAVYLGLIVVLVLGMHATHLHRTF